MVFKGITFSCHEAVVKLSHALRVNTSLDSVELQLPAGIEDLDVQALVKIAIMQRITPWRKVNFTDTSLEDEVLLTLARNGYPTDSKLPPRMSVERLHSLRNML